MGFTIQCDNKGCRKYQDPSVDLKGSEDPDKWEVICEECGQPIKSVTYFAKVQMRHMGQILKQKKHKEAFVVKCEHCLKEAKPKIGLNETLICVHCGKEFTNLTEEFKRMLLTVLRKP